MDVVNSGLDAKYAYAEIDDTWKAYDSLTFGTAKQILSYVWNDRKVSEAALDFRCLISDENYWDAVENHSDWNPDSWTRDWFFAQEVVDKMSEALAPQA